MWGWVSYMHVHAILCNCRSFLLGHRIVCERVYVWTQRLWLHSWSVCKDKRCVSRDPTFNPFASAGTVSLNRHQHFVFNPLWNNEILQYSSSSIYLIAKCLKRSRHYKSGEKKDILERCSRDYSAREKDNSTQNRQKERGKTRDRWGDGGRGRRRRRGFNLLGGLEIKALSGKVIIESSRLMITSEIHGSSRD